MKRRFKQVDVFTTQPFQGNPVAVVLDCDGLDTEAMQRIARWTNLSETTFVLPPTQAGADYRVRIFTPGAELPFAGHPTIGTAHAVIEAGLVSSAKTALVQECKAGLLPLTREASPVQRLYVRVPEPKCRPVDRAHYDALRTSLGADFVSDPAPTIVDVGAVWIIAQLANEAAVANVRIDAPAMTALSNALGAGGVTVFARLPRGSGDAIKVRAFAPAHGIAEDPVCGSGNACVGAYLTQHASLADLLPAYSASQGREIGRDGHVFVRAQQGAVQIGGSAVTCIDGMLDC